MSGSSIVVLAAMRREDDRRKEEERRRRNEEIRRRREEEERRRNEENNRRQEEEGRRRKEESRRYQERRVKEKLYAKHRSETTDEHRASESQTTFSAKCLHSKDELFDDVVSYDGYAYGCADGSSITKDVDGEYYIKKMPNGVVQTYKDIGVPGGRRGILYALCREDLPDGRVRVYDTKCRYDSNGHKMRSYTNKESEYFISYERDADGSYRRYDVTDEKEECSDSYRSDRPYKTMLIEDVKAGKESHTVSEENIQHKDMGKRLEKARRRIKSEQISGVVVADKIAEDIISGRETRTVTYEVGRELSDKYKRKYALSRRENKGK